VDSKSPYLMGERRGRDEVVEARRRLRARAFMRARVDGWEGDADRWVPTVSE
jgi:hypothetical protein